MQKTPSTGCLIQVIHIEHCKPILDSRRFTRGEKVGVFQTQSLNLCKEVTLPTLSLLEEELELEVDMLLQLEHPKTILLAKP